MSKKRLEIYVVLGEAPNSALAVKIWLEPKGDLYVRTLDNPIAGKFSYHETGVTHHYVDLIQRRVGTGKPPERKLKDIKGYKEVTGFVTPGRVEPSGYAPKKDTKTRRTLIAPSPEIGWCFNVWAIEPGRRDLAEKIAQTNPWQTVPIGATLLVDCDVPWLLVTVAYMITEKPYDIIQFSPPIPGRIPFEVVPRAFEGTWLESPRTDDSPVDRMIRRLADQVIAERANASGSK
jgi:hypothetical protein